MINGAFDTVYDDEDDPFDTDLKYFTGSFLKDIRINAENSENPKQVYFGDVTRAEGIDIFAFMKKHMPKMPCAGTIIAQMLSQPAASSLAEITFSYGRYVL